jgi:class 3 adenylate cyclase
MTISIRNCRPFDAFAMIVDLNGFTRMVARDEVGTVAQDTRDALTGGIRAVEENAGLVVGFMGDAFLAILEDDESVVLAALSTAKDLDRTCEWISDAQSENPNDWSHMAGGPSLKILIEYGRIDVSTIASKFLGEQFLLAGVPINYAACIGSFGTGNRCLLGPEAAKRIGRSYPLEGPHTTKGKKGEPPYTCYRFDMGDVWKEGKRQAGEDTFWG